MKRKRPVFHPEIGKSLEELREAHGWTQRQAALLASQKGHAALTRQILFRLEKGQVKNPEPDVLRAVAGLYGLAYEPLAARFAAASYRIEINGSDLVWQSGSQTSESSKGEESDVPASAAPPRIQQQHEALLAATKDVARQLFEALAAQGVQVPRDHAQTRTRQPRTRGRS